MSNVWLPCGDYHQNYAEDQGWWQSKLIKGKMILLLAIIFVGIPWLASEYWVSVATMIGYTTMGALGVQLLIGYTGQISFGQAGFLCIGAFSFAHLAQAGLPWYLGLPCAGIITGLFGFLVGFPSLRLKGPYLAIATLGFGIAVH